ncbi:SDR family NAD(P)-dependent oxidoreductase [Streptomyces sp. NPDC060194]|uniref:SDR family NAD(P)-dependent oxidoreductase n=1 Tax=Streptomyces sp. NPDC060194 TaxID=3347069 RepID=UPI003657B302
MPHTPLDGKRVVVTGAARGIGAAIAAACHRAGADVVALDRDPSPSDTPYPLHPIDVTDAVAVDRLIAGLDGPVDCLVNNAGINRRAPIAELAGETWSHVHQVNLASPVRLVQQFLPVLRTPGASVVNISSIRGSRGFPDDVAYIATKGGLDAATRALAVELGPRGVRVNSVAPGAIETELNREALADPVNRERATARIPLGRIGEPDEIAGPVVFLASDAARFVTGTVLTADGGQCAAG